MPIATWRRRWRATIPTSFVEIQSLNPQGLLVLGQLFGALQRLTEIVGTGGESALLRLMDQGRRYLAQGS